MQDSESEGRGAFSQTEQNALLFLLTLLMMVLTYLHELGGWPYVGLGFVAGLVMIAVVIGTAEKAHENANEIAAELQRPQRDSQIICPHCQVRGHVTTKRVHAKQGISGGKATAALLTGGLSLLATGLSQHQKVTKATCSNCGSVWHF